MLCAYVDEPGKVTPAQMDRQARAFDNWAICDTLCFALWVRTPHAFAKIRQWASHRDEFVKRAAFALLASVALKDKTATDAQFLRCLPLIEKAATRRAQLRQERRQLGAARRRRTQSRAQQGRGRAGEQTRHCQRVDAALDRQGRAAATRQRGHAAAPEETLRRRCLTTATGRLGQERGLMPRLPDSARLPGNQILEALARRQRPGIRIIRQEWAGIGVEHRLDRVGISRAAQCALESPGVHGADLRVERQAARAQTHSVMRTQQPPQPMQRGGKRAIGIEPIGVRPQLVRQPAGARPAFASRQQRGQQLQ